MRKREEPRQPVQSLTLSKRNPEQKHKTEWTKGGKGLDQNQTLQGARVFCKGLIMVVLREPVRTSLNRGPQEIPYL